MLFTRLSYPRRQRPPQAPTPEPAWLDADPPTWEFPPSWGRQYFLWLVKNALFAIRYGGPVR